MNHLLNPALLLATLSLSACSLAPTAPAKAVYDLGPAPVVAPSAALTWRIADVTAPPWLATDGIAYRLLFREAQRLEHYRDSAWAAPPPALLTQRLRERIGLLGACPASPATLVAVHLDEFEQVFSGPASSRAVLRVHVTLWAGGAVGTGPQQHWRLERATAPDAAGAVRGLAQAVDDWLPLLSAWLEGSCQKSA
ncbi:MAG: ABC transporter [Rubrivivax sp.]|nr:MAG: ABC transporter [Rubrivivax sp.]